jgi:hypothetical protein
MFYPLKESVEDGDSCQLFDLLNDTFLEQGYCILREFSIPLEDSALPAVTFPQQRQS